MNTLTKGLAAALAMTLAACSGGGGSSSGGTAPVVPATVTVTCPNGTQQTAATADAANAACSVPKLVSVTPADGTTGVSPDSFAGLTVVTDSTLDTTSLSTANVTLKVGSTTSIAGTVAATDGKGFKWTPTAKLAYGQKYDFAANVKDTLGRALAVSGSFTTALISCTAPLVPDSTGTTCVAAQAKGLSLIAGQVDSPGSRDGNRLEATFHSPFAMTRDAQGNVYVADGKDYISHANIRKISPTGIVTTVAGSPSYDVSPQPNLINRGRYVTGLTTHPDGNLYTYDMFTKQVQRITPQGQATVIAGELYVGGNNDGAGTAAHFDGFSGIAADAQGMLYVTDNANHAIRRIDTNGNVTTFAGLTGSRGSTDGPLQSARFNYPYAIKFDAVSGRLYIGDTNGIRIIANSQVSTLIPWQTLRADICTDPYVSSPHSPYGLDVASDGRIAVTFGSCDNTVGIYKNGQLQSKLGLAKPGYIETDVDGSANVGNFNDPSGLVFQDNGDLLVANRTSHNLRRYVSASNSIERYAGMAYNTTAGLDDGKGSGARIAHSWCPYIAKNGDVWFWQGNNTLLSAWRRADSAGNVTTLVAPADVGGMSCILKVNDDGSFIEVGQAGDTASTIHKGEIRQRSSTGARLATLATFDDFYFLAAPLMTPSGDIYLIDDNGGIKKYANGTVTTLVQLDTRNNLRGLALLPTGDLIASTANDGIWKVTSSGQTSNLVPIGNPSKSDGGAVGEAWIGNGGPLAVDAKGAIYIANQVGSVIRRIANGRVDIVVGTFGINETVLGPGPGSIYEVRDFKYDPARNSLVILTWNGLLRAALPD